MRVAIHTCLKVLFCLLVVSCKKENNNTPEEPASSFDKQAMLVQLSDQLIVPAYETFKNSLDSLLQVYSEFKNQPDLAGLQRVKAKFQIAYTRYQRCGLFEFGPAESTIVRSNFNVFPADTQQIKSNMASGVYDLNIVSNLDAKGFPALDYLFYGSAADEASVLSAFTVSVARGNYGSAVLSDMSARIQTVLSAWKTGYRNTFVNSLGTDVGSSIGFLINQMNFELDYLKNAKIGIPLGKKTLGVVQPAQCEAYYSGQSLQLAMETLKAIENCYLGKGLDGNNGKGFDDYLDHLEIMRGTESLNAAIVKQFSVATAKLNALQGSLSNLVLNNPAAVDSVYVELVKLLVLLKTDLPSGLGVVITYQDGDGD